MTGRFDIINELGLGVVLKLNLSHKRKMLRLIMATLALDLLLPVCPFVIESYLYVTFRKFSLIDIFKVIEFIICQNIDLCRSVIHCNKKNTFSVKF